MNKCHNIMISKVINDFFHNLIGSTWYGISSFLSGLALSIVFQLTTAGFNAVSKHFQTEIDGIDLWFNNILKIISYLMLLVFAVSGIITIFFEHYKIVKEKIDEVINRQSEHFDPSPLPGKTAETTRVIQDSIPREGEIESIEGIEDVLNDQTEIIEDEVTKKGEDE